MKSLAFLIPVLIVFVLLFGCPGIEKGGSGTQCPSSLQSCGSGCIPTNAICCDDGAINGYCLQPSTGCGNGTCSSCPAGQVYCGMFCKPIGEKCCVGDDCGAVTTGGTGTGTLPGVGSSAINYEGTYNGTFKYKYWPNKQPDCFNHYQFDEVNCKPIINEDSFNMTFTLKYKDKGSFYYMDVTGVSSNEPGFGTTGSVVPKSSTVRLPLIVPNNTPDTMTGEEIIIVFPNGTEFAVSDFLVSDAQASKITLQPEYLKRFASDDDVTRSWTSTVFNDRTGQDGDWSFWETVGSWTLTKISG